jgi:hypothetical protein
VQVPWCLYRQQGRKLQTFNALEEYPMKNLMFPLLFVLGGCIIYDHNGKCHDCDFDTGFSDEPGTGNNNGNNNGGNQDDSSASDDSGEPTESVPQEASFTLTPNSATGGDTLIASLTAENFDLTTVASTEFFGSVDVLASENRGTEILFTLSIPADAATGTADLVLVLADGTVELLDDVLSITAAEGASPAGEDSGTGDGCQ